MIFLFDENFKLRNKSFKDKVLENNVIVLPKDVYEQNKFLKRQNEELKKSINGAS